MTSIEAAAANRTWNSIETKRAPLGTSRYVPRYDAPTVDVVYASKETADSTLVTVDAGALATNGSSVMPAWNRY